MDRSCSRKYAQEIGRGALGVLWLKQNSLQLLGLTLGQSSSALEGKSKLDHWSEILSSLVVVSSDDSAKAILSSPGYTNQQKTEFFLKVF